MSKEFTSIRKTIKHPIHKSESTKHLSHDRLHRLMIAEDLIERESGHLIASFICDYGHHKGEELHNIYSNGVIKIYNNKTKKFITVLIARPSHIKRYYQGCGIPISNIPADLLSICNKHKLNNYNEIS